MNTVNPSTWISKALILISCFSITSSAAELLTHPTGEREGCAFQAGLAITVHKMKNDNVTESFVLNEVKSFEDPVPQWLYVRYQQIVRDIYRDSRDIEDYAAMVYDECRTFELYADETHVSHK